MARHGWWGPEESPTVSQPRSRRWAAGLAGLHAPIYLFTVEIPRAGPRHAPSGSGGAEIFQKRARPLQRFSQTTGIRRPCRRAPRALAARAGLRSPAGTRGARPTCRGAAGCQLLAAPSVPPGCWDVGARGGGTRVVPEPGCWGGAGGCGVGAVGFAVPPMCFLLLYMCSLWEALNLSFLPPWGQCWQGGPSTGSPKGCGAQWAWPWGWCVIPLHPGCASLWRQPMGTGPFPALWPGCSGPLGSHHRAPCALGSPGRCLCPLEPTGADFQAKPRASGRGDSCCRRDPFATNAVAAAGAPWGHRCHRRHPPPRHGSPAKGVPVTCPWCPG